ncbi:PREDICTED: biogenesis of lysosome-related organelles complex 1 subunit 3 [Bison bison bison]|uniref:Biogenesis of lysosome-related organelles complex 1 subunit 3 n=1 Tax=Bison bison bison TaxID=43346 RepID=A0A6P3I8T4_BISBB|nr:PREDICTED: biogenesis of lysosome-related organelles complex 1 subunit 3 [Bison bison bison]
MESQSSRRRPLRRPETLVQGEAAESDSDLSASSSEEEELYLGPSGPTRGRPTGLRVAGEAAETDSDPEPEPKAAPRDLPPLVAAGLAAAHSVRLARGDLCALAERLDIVASCRLLPDIRGVPGTEPEQDPGPRA